MAASRMQKPVGSKHTGSGLSAAARRLAAASSVRRSTATNVRRARVFLRAADYSGPAFTESLRRGGALLFVENPQRMVMTGMKSIDDRDKLARQTERNLQGLEL